MLPLTTLDAEIERAKSDLDAARAAVDAAADAAEAARSVYHDEVARCAATHARLATCIAAKTRHKAARLAARAVARFVRRWAD